MDNYKKKYDFENLCLAGGVALNCTVNNKISKLNFIEKLYIQPSASDRGLPLGAAIYATVSKGIRFEPLKIISMDHDHLQMKSKMSRFK